MSSNLQTQNSLLLTNLMNFYQKDNNLDKILNIINGESKISLRLIDWFATNYSKRILRYISWKTMKERYIDLRYI